ncbi:MAG: Flp pilus assembly complex ATPase component TadA [Planctomycetes bacterium]|jgi:general secretion pathway protein E|nr:Flp pilus assembly complex ATPase component TadA [Planctomycetota bacterium]HON44844.1 ATPase, T2SS/T4P/T4SS family [Planctomycetota bacterium]HPY75802.1 ATPase, T2SS/T4P/T4SS family [Planctomycetota bacterium]HQB00597.1 ATPase, T2SS/T4P/T4SS family [Planctomycetota bacterium]HRU51831.1 ATPase, T2SS/T4P/T4SS family [Planctomycetota bacterium]
MINKNKLLEIFVTNGLLDESKIGEIIAGSEEFNLSIDQFMIQRGYITEKDFLQVFADEFGFRLVEKIDPSLVPESFCRKVPINFSRNYNLIAIGMEGNIYQIATCTPLLTHPMDELASLLDAELDSVLAPRSEIVAVINNAYKQNINSETNVADLDEDSDGVDDFDEEEMDILDASNKPPIIRTVNNIILQAIKQRVSDIHLQPYEEKLQVRYRIDGILYDVQSVPKKHQDAIISRVKVMGRMDIAEKRLPQDGRKTIKMGDSEVDIRISSVPTSHGERIVMRLLDKSARMYSLDEIGLDKKNLKMIEQFIHFTHGIMLVTGPTGSGKSTTLYGSLLKINAIEKNVMTIEDPIEYHLRNISQIQVSEKKGLTFAMGLRTLLRQDPDIIMLGEIRDEETARIAIQAALTGHLVFSTMHTNDSASAMTRLLDIGVEPYLVSSSVICVIAQRLARRICTGCQEEYEPTVAKLQSIGLSRTDLGPKGTLMAGSGCEKCMRTGYKDRIGLYEILPITDRVREQVIQRLGATIIKQEAVKRGLRTLRMDGAKKVLEGAITIDEVLRVTQMDTI